MTVTAFIVLYAVIWFMCLFIALPLRVTTQNDTGDVIPGTAPSAPVDAMMWRKARWVTVIATAIWAVVCGIILSGAIAVADFDIFHRM